VNKDVCICIPHFQNGGAAPASKAINAQLLWSLICEVSDVKDFHTQMHINLVFNKRVTQPVYTHAVFNQRTMEPTLYTGSLYLSLKPKSKTKLTA